MAVGRKSLHNIYKENHLWLDDPAAVLQNVLERNCNTLFSFVAFFFWEQHMRTHYGLERLEASLTDKFMKTFHKSIQQMLIKRVNMSVSKHLIGKIMEHELPWCQHKVVNMACLI